MMEVPVNFSEVAATAGKRIGLIQLNMPKALNALSLEMIDLMAPKLSQWEQDADICCVWLEGMGDRAFCAGGDIRALYEGMTGKRPASFCQDFFTREYQMDFHIHCYSKPLLCWGDGLVMGGGIGMMSGAPYRVVTERSRLSMPEVSIGLYPDVAGSWFLNRMAGKAGLFLALTGAPLNGRDALMVDLADYFISSESREDLFDQLLKADWGSTLSDFHQTLVDVLNPFQQQSLALLPESQLYPHTSQISELMAEPQIAVRVEKLLDLPPLSPWFEKAQQSLAAGSPSSVAIIDRQLQDCRLLSLAEVYRRELNLSMNCADDGEFAEGVRALLIDKDGEPHWRFNTVAEVEADWLNQMFQPRWLAEEHPLRDL